MPSQETLLDEDEAPPVIVSNSDGASPILLVGDHAGNAIPRKLLGLGISEMERQRHIGWDIGVRALGERLAARLDATFIHQHYSRLVIDCNRDPDSPDATPESSDGTIIPGNQALSSAGRQHRIDAIHRPYQDKIASVLTERDNSARQTILVALHSFTPTMDGTDRPWHAGILYSDGDTGFAQALLSAMQQHDDLMVGDNEPYRMDSTDHTVPLHAFLSKRHYAEIEIRQDLIAELEGQQLWADRLAVMLTVARGQCLAKIKAAHPCQRIRISPFLG